MDQEEVWFEVTEEPDGGYTARAQGYAIFTEGVDLRELRENVVDAVRCHFDEGERPRRVRLRFVRDEVLTV